MSDGLTSAAADAWAAEGYDLDDADGWEPLEGGAYITGEVDDLVDARVGVTGAIASARVGGAREDRVDESRAQVSYSSRGVTLDLAVTEPGGAEASTGFDLAADQAKALAVALWQAGRELEERRAEE